MRQANMDNVNFNYLVRPLNRKYKEIFGYIPRIIDYSCSREEYLDAMEKSIKTQKSLSLFLVKRENDYRAILEMEED